jgi:hypothetical protein
VLTNAVGGGYLSPAMSKGPGVIQRGVIELFRRRPFAVFTLERLTQKLFGDSTRTQRISVMRAVRSLAKSGVLPLTWKERKERGAPLIVWRTDNETACWRADNWKDWLWGTSWPTRGTKPPTDPIIELISDVRAELKKRGWKPTT